MNSQNVLPELPNRFNEFLKECHELIEDVWNCKKNREDFNQFEIAFERHVKHTSMTLGKIATKNPYSILLGS